MSERISKIAESIKERGKGTGKGIPNDAIVDILGGLELEGGSHATLDIPLAPDVEMGSEELLPEDETITK